MPIANRQNKIPEDLKRCVRFHGHICPGLIYGYRVSKEAMRLMNIKRSVDEEVVAVCENDSCAVDALQVLLGTVAGKGNLIINNVGKNAYTVLNRETHQAYRFSRRKQYHYNGDKKQEFALLDAAANAGTASDAQRRELKRMKIDDLLARPFREIFTTKKVRFEEPLYAPLAPSEPCAVCGEMTMATKMVRLKSGEKVCLPCFEKSSSRA